MLSRRDFLKALAAMTAGSTGLAGYAFGVEPYVRLKVTTYRPQLPRWPGDLKLKVAVIADLHACEPWVGVPRIRQLVDRTNALGADIILLLGDYVAGHHFVTDWVHSSVWAPELGRLSAPLGVHAVLGNHDWWEDRTAQTRGAGPTFGGEALSKAGIKVYENDVIRIEKDGQPFWLAGLGDQIAFLPGEKWGRDRFSGVDDLEGTLAQITDDAPVILMAHEPDIFPRVPASVALTLSGHTHGGQVRLFGYSPVVPSRYRNRFAYGHIVEDDRHLIVSGGLGCSIVPLRLGVPPEIVVVELGGGAAA